MVSSLVVVTVYSAHSFYAYLFPDTISALLGVLLHPFDVPNGATRDGGKESITAGHAGAHQPKQQPPQQTAAATAAHLSTVFATDMDHLREVQLWSWWLFGISVALLLMDTWAYIMAVKTPPGRVPAVFRQRAAKSASLALCTFYEPLVPPTPVASRSEAGNSAAMATASAASQPVGLYPPMGSTSDLGHSHGKLRTFRASKVPSTKSGAEEVGGAGAAGGASFTADAEGSRASQPLEQFYFNPKANSYTSVENNYLHFCPMCVTYKPPRAHHCSRCNFCVLRYDHHCPWLGQCVGFFNYKNYLLVLFYTWILTFWVLMLLSVAIGAYLLDRGASSFLSSAAPTTMAPRTGLGVGATILEELNVGPPFFGVFVCTAQSLLFFSMSTYLLCRHVVYARHSITTIDVVIHENERRMLDRCDLVESEEDEMTSRASAVPQSILRSLQRSNIYDLGVRRNLLQVFGDAQLHMDRDGPSPSPPFYRDLMESDVPRYSNFIQRWFWRLLPFPAYPPQRQWLSMDVMKAATTSTPTAHRRGLLNFSGHHRTYGTMQSCEETNAPISNVGGGAQLLQQLGVVEEQLLGLRFPTRLSLGLVDERV